MEWRIRLISEMLEQTGEGTPSPQSPLMWEATFARITDALNDLPKAKGNSHSGTVTGNFDNIMPNKILLGRNNRRGMSGEGIHFESSANLQRMLAWSHEIFSTWYRLYIVNIHILNATLEKWRRDDPPLNPGDVVLFVAMETTSRSKRSGVWRLGQVLTATDRKVRTEQMLKS